MVAGSIYLLSINLFIIGNANNNSLLEIWEGVQLQTLKEKFLKVLFWKIVLIVVIQREQG